MPKESPRFRFVDSALSEALEERQELIRWTVSARLSGKRLRFRERLLFDLHIRV